MTILPPTAEDALSFLRAQVDELARALSTGAGSSAEGVQIKQRIFLLHRSVEQHAQLIETLQGEVRALVDGWKETYGGSTPTASASIAATPAASATPIRSETVVAEALPVAVGAATPVAVTAVLEPDTVAAPEIAVPQVVQPVPVATPTHARPGIGAPMAGQPRVIDELNASTFVERGWSRIATGDFAGAEEALEKAMALNPGDPNAEVLLGWAEMGQGRLDEAMAIFAQVLERVPDQALARMNVGCVHLRRGEHAQAREHLGTAIALDSDRKAVLYAHFYLGLTYFAEEQYAESIGELLRAIELGPNLIEARFELGRVFWFADRTDDAIAAWRKGAELNKFNPWSARCRDMLLLIADGGVPSRVG
ncbi:MAG: tetratricopeptide repeat protein [Gemmatimonadota bacterium]